jgi:hypothetical protein
VLLVAGCWLLVVGRGAARLPINGRRFKVVCGSSVKAHGTNNQQPAT